MLVNTQNVLRKTHEETIVEERNVRTIDITECLVYRTDDHTVSETSRRGPRHGLPEARFYKLP